MVTSLYPGIDAEGNYNEALLIENTEYWEISNLEITNTGPTREDWRYGVRVSSWNYGKMRHIHLKKLYIHDVNALGIKQDRVEGHGILYENGGDMDKQSHIDGLLIENCHFIRTDRNGIGGHSDYVFLRGNWLPNTNVVIRNNLLEDIGGDGIKICYCDSALVEYNIVHGASRRDDHYSAGIWPGCSTNTLIQFNEVSGMEGTEDSEGFDIDFYTRNTIIQYNYSHDNEGGFILICNPRTSYGNSNNIIRYNISQNDRNRTFLFLGPVNNTQIYNNVIYVKEELNVQLFLFTPWEDGVWANNVSVYNNIFYAEGTAKYVHSIGYNSNGTYRDAPGFGQANNVNFDYNVFYGNHIAPPQDAHKITDNPLLNSPGTGADGLNSLVGYKLMNNSPCIGAGLLMPDNGGYDFWRNPVPADSKPDIGANQF